VRLDRSFEPGVDDGGSDLFAPLSRLTIELAKGEPFTLDVPYNTWTGRSHLSVEPRDNHRLASSSKARDDVPVGEPERRQRT
jgi:hypothetical protein